MRKFCKTFVVALGLGITGVASAAGNLFVNLSDVVAGEAASVRISGLMAEEKVGLVLVRPDKTELLLSAQADDLGVLNTNIFALHLQKAGNYQLEISRSFSPSTPEIKSFAVASGPVSAYRSTIELRDGSIAADGTTEGFFTIKLLDAYANNVTGIPVQVFSSRNEDLVIAERKSNEYGELQGRIRSKTPGISTLSVLADDTMVFEKAEVVFHLADTAMKNVGAPDLGQFLKAQLFDDASFQSVAYFTIEDMPSEVFMDKRYTFRVVAKDEDGKVVPNFLGKVRFASSDAQSTIPADYEFDETDQGVHTFALSVVFGSEGEHTLTVHDTGDFRIAGEATVTVVDGSKASTGDETAGITILTPIPGTLRDSRVTITGKAIGTRYVKIEDGPTELIADLETDSSGSFIYQTPSLADGVHRFRASSPDGALVSQEVTITVDQSAPTVMSIELEPRRVMDVNEAFTVKVSSNEPLSEAKCILNEVLTDLDLSGDRFVGSFQAPKTCGVYPISCTIADLLGNKLSEPNAETLQVCGENPAETGDTPKKPDTIAPTSVMNLTAKPGDNRVTLFWSPAKDDQEVTQYRILYGTAKDKLDQSNITNDNRTQWYVDGLDTGRKYFFQVFAMDNEGKTGVGSRIAEATTNGTSVHTSAPKSTPTSGGNHWLPAGIALLVGFVFMLMMRRKA